MTLLKKIDKLIPQLDARVIQLEPNLFIMLGSECFSGSLKGLSAYSSLRKIIIEKGEDFFVNKRLLDASSGNFGRALALLAEYLSLDCEVIVSTKATKATLELIKVHGAKLTIGGDTTLDCYVKAKELTKHNPEKYVLVGQLDNWGNPEGHRLITGPSITRNVPNVKNVYMAMGSGGGMCGVAEYLNNSKSSNTALHVTVAEPGNKIVGTFSNGIDYETPFIKLARKSNWITTENPITKREAVKGMIELRKKYGILVGLSAGGVYSAYKKKKGVEEEPSIILAWDSHDRWIDVLE